MSTTLTINGSSYNYPSTTDDIDWGDEATAAMTALSTYALYSGVSGQAIPAPVISGGTITSASIATPSISDPTITGISKSTTAISTTNKVLDETFIDAKGDLIAGTANNTLTRLAVGTNGQILSADSGEATGLKYINNTGAFPVQIQGIVYTGDNIVYCDVPFGVTVTKVFVSNGSPPTSGTATIDIRYGVSSITATTILNSDIVIPEDSRYATVDSFATTALAENTRLYFDINSTSGNTMADLQITVMFTK